MNKTLTGYTYHNWKDHFCLIMDKEAQRDELEVHKIMIPSVYKEDGSGLNPVKVIITIEEIR